HAVLLSFPPRRSSDLKAACGGRRRRGPWGGRFAERRVLPRRERCFPRRFCSSESWKRSRRRGWLTSLPRRTTNGAPAVAQGRCESEKRKHAGEERRS